MKQIGSATSSIRWRCSPTSGPPERRPVNIHVVLAHVKSLIEAGLTHPVAIREEYDPSLPPLLGNRDQLIQIFVNLVKNAVEAIEATGQAGEVILSTAFRPGMKLSASNSGDRVSLPLEVCVHDTGSGIPEDVRPHIFDPFVTTKAGGRGLGPRPCRQDRPGPWRRRRELSA